VRSDEYDVFISYSRLDAQHAADLDLLLRTKGLETFFDRANLPPGLPWVQALEAAINHSKAILILIGTHGLGNTQQYERQYALFRQAREHAFPVIPVLLPGVSSTPVGFLQLLTWIDFSHCGKVNDAPGELQRLLTAVRGESAQSETPRETICPYRGLDPFREEDAPFFFGRGNADDPTTPIGALIQKVREHPFVMVVGRSGSGKSSLVFAGLMPALRRSRDKFWTVVSVRPGSDALRALAEAFNPRGEDQGLAEYAMKITREVDALKSGDPDQLAQMIRHYLSSTEGNPDRLLLYVDQWEELYTQTPEQMDRSRSNVERFIELLLNASRSAPVTVVGTVRADFYDPLISHPEIRSLLPDQQVLLGSMTRSELESTIVEPARLVGLAFDPPSLVERILDDAGADEGMLPLLQYALKETWNQCEGRLLTGDSYARSGGVREAIRVTAERTFDALSPADQRAAKQLFLRLVSPGEGQEDTRARAAMPTESEQVRIITQFAGARTRLLVTGLDRAKRPTVEVAHEALIRNWPRFREWINANREKLRARAAVLQAQTDWDQHERRDDMLLPAGFALERARELLADPGDITVGDIEEYIKKSISRDQARIDQEKAAEFEEARQAAEDARVRAELEQRRADAERQAREISDASRRKLMRYLFAAAGALAVAIASAVWAMSERSLAGQRLGLARTTAERLVALIPNDLRKVQGVQIKTLRQILDNAKQSYDILKKALWNDQSFRVSYANMMTEFGKTYLRVGDLERAIASFDESQGIRQTNVRHDFTESSSNRGIADQIDEIGMALQQQGNLKKALDQFDRAFAIRSEIVNKDRTNPKSYLDLGQSLNRRGDVLLLTGADPQYVLAMQTAARDQTSHAHKLGADADDVNFSLALIYGSLGDAYGALQNDKDEQASFLKSRDLLEELTAAHPDNPEFKRYLGWAYQALGSYYADQNQWDQALPLYQDCLSVRDQLAKFDAGDWIYQYDLAWAHHLLGNWFLYSNQVNIDNVSSHYDEAFKIRQRLTDTDPSNQRWHKDFALSWEALGDVAYRRKQTDGALEKYREAQKHFKHLIALDPNNAGWNRQLSVVETKISRVERGRASADPNSDSK
jgi:tetratricopeptide (TPR) repeat protein